jgi:ADP-ribosylglycohydrolase
MEMNARAMVMASFAADSLALGAHWIYDREKLATDFGRVETLLKPLKDSYHPSKDKGEFTHYGDQTMILLESVAASQGFDLDDFALRWKALFANYHGYFDKATKVTLENFAAGKWPNDAGSPSSDLAGAGRIAPLLFYYQTDPETLIKACRAQTQMTHHNPQVTAGAEFFAKVTWQVLRGAKPTAAIQQMARAPFEDVPIAQWVADGFDSVKMDTVSAIAQLGQSCHTSEAFPAVIHLIAKYETNLRDALIECVMAGGDSAARGMLTGMVLGAHLGEPSIPREWTTALKGYKLINDLLDRLVLQTQP